MGKKTLAEIESLARKILTTYFCDSDMEFMISTFADDIVWLGSGEQQKAEGKEAVAAVFRSGKDGMIACDMCEEQYHSIDLGGGSYLCEAVSRLISKPESETCLNIQQRATFIFREKGDGLETVHIHNSVPFSEIQDDELFPVESGRQAFERFANFAYVPMPGGAAAIKHPLRMAYGVLWAYDLLEHPAAAAALAPLGDEAEVCDTMIERGLNTPMTSSVGRLFDAASALLGICTEPSYEGEGAILLETAMETAGADVAGAAAVEEAAGVAGEDELAAKERYAVIVEKNTATETSTAQDTSVLLLDAEPTFHALLDDLAAGVPASVISRRFHDAMVGAIVMSAELVRAMYDISTVALSGGVFMNRYLVEHALADLAAAGFTVAINRDLPPNDGCISLGQAVVASARSGE